MYTGSYVCLTGNKRKNYICGYTEYQREHAQLASTVTKAFIYQLTKAFVTKNVLNDFLQLHAIYITPLHVTPYIAQVRRHSYEHEL